MSQLYESKYARFMKAWMEKHPEEKQVQRDGRALWWDEPVLAKEAPVLSPRPYSYDDNFQRPPKRRM